MNTRRRVNIFLPALGTAIALAGVILIVVGLIHAHNFFADAALSDRTAQKYDPYSGLWWVSLALFPLLPLGLEVKATLGYRYSRASLYALLAAGAVGVPVIVTVLLMLNQFCLNVSSVCAGQVDDDAYRLWGAALLSFVVVGLGSLVCMGYFLRRSWSVQ